MGLWASVKVQLTPSTGPFGISPVRNIICPVLDSEPRNHLAELGREGEHGEKPEAERVFHVSLPSPEYRRKS
jgi:hypothetical protein